MYMEVYRYYLYRGARAILYTVNALRLSFNVAVLHYYILVYIYIRRETCSIEYLFAESFYPRSTREGNCASIESSLFYGSLINESGHGFSRREDVPARIII